MKQLLEEIEEIPQKARLCYAKNNRIKLPRNVPYLGMGASYFAPLTLYYCGAEIFPEIASEYYYYLSENKLPLGVLVSQSGETSETVWNIDKFEKYVAITDNKESRLSRSTSQLIEIYADEESFSSTKSFVNTLIVLYIGLGFSPGEAIELISKNFTFYNDLARNNVQNVFDFAQKNKVKGYFVLGSGPNIGTAYEAALTLSETTKIPWSGMPLAQYDHGPKEAVNNSVIITLNANGKEQKRINAFKEKISAKSDCLIIEIKENEVKEIYSPLTLIVQMNLFMSYFADILKVDTSFTIGEKVTKISDDLK